jgi:hypothetical protein
MRFFVIMWILNISNLQGVKHVYEGTVEECLREALEFNATETKSYAGCYVDVEQYDFVPPEDKRHFNYEKESY